MTIDELIERLEEYRDALGGDAEVRLMTQQNWPFENEIVGLASGEEMNAAGDAAAERDEDVAVVASHKAAFAQERNVWYGDAKSFVFLDQEVLVTADIVPRYCESAGKNLQDVTRDRGKGRCA